MGDTHGNVHVDTNAGNVNVPEEAANKPATTIAGVEQMLEVTTEGALDTGAALTRIATIMVSRGLLNTWAIGDTMSLEKDKEVTAETAKISTAAAAEEEGGDVHVEGIMPADKLL